MANPRMNFYKPLILIIFCSFLVFSAWSARQAANHGSQVTDRDYYSKGLKYNSTMVEKKAAEVLGWSLSTELSGRTLIFQVMDAEKNSVGDAQATLTLDPPGSSEEKSFDLKPSSAGVYRFELPADLSGTLRARVTFERDGARLNRQLQLNI